MKPDPMWLICKDIIDKVQQSRKILAEDLVSYIVKKTDYSASYVRNVIWGLLADDVLEVEDHRFFVIGQVPFMEDKPPY